MCGICGRINDHSSHSVDRDTLEKMAALLKHRGPDDVGVYCSGNIGLAHTRLSIIDLSTNGHQPMCNEDQSIWITFNGEIYNFPELKQELMKKGHVFRSHSDTEVIVHLYEEKGVKCVDDLRGMFAFVIWDGRNERLFMARDRAGKKPLHYAVVNQDIIFASEIKAILADKSVPVSVNHKAVYYYNTFSYIPAPLTAYEGINKLPPAHYLVYENGKITLAKYWTLDYNNKIEVSGRKKEEELKEQILFQLEEATKIRLISDVPLGAFLSGGIDSSAVVAYASKHSVKKFKTFSIRFNEEEYDESEYARKVSKLFGTEHHEFVVKPDAMGIMDQLVWHYDEPFADSSAIPTFYVSKMARDYVTVALTGDGGDESFAGYPRYAANNLAERLHRIPLYKQLVGTKWFRDSLQNYKSYNSKLTSMKRLAYISGMEGHERFYQWSSWRHDDQLFSPEFYKTVGEESGMKLMHEWFSRENAQNIVDKSLNYDVNTYLPYDLLVKVDIASMANSLELRSPFLDHKFMEFAASIPAKYKTTGSSTKYVLKKALEKVLPKEILYRKKMGFGLPVEKWFRNELRELVYDTILSRRFFERGYYNRAYVEKMVNEHMSQKRNFRFEIWNLLMLELWHRKFVDTHSILK